ncbi:MAG: thermonuclease family protein [Candidatus Omnitrophota bacterium]
MRFKRTYLIIILIIIVLILSGVFRTDDKEVYVTHVIDGDTVVLSDGSKIRYIGINTPETRKRIGDTWLYDPKPYSEEAKLFNESLVGGKKVNLEFDVEKKDKYGRTLAYLYVDGKMVNIEMIKNGFSIAYPYPPNDRYINDLLEAEGSARDNKLGIWGDILKEVITPSEAKDHIGLIKTVEAGIVDTYLSEDVLILKCTDGFNIVIFKDNFKYFPAGVCRMPDNYFKDRLIRVYGLIKEYKGGLEIIMYHPNQMKFIERVISG